MSIKLTFCGGVRTVTGSMHLVQTDSQNILIDAGLFQGHRDDYYNINSSFPFNPNKLDGLIISHSHIDHCGNLPTLIKNGFKAKIFLTKPSKDLCRLMLLDSARIQEEDIKFVNKINARKKLPLRRPLYTTEDAKKAFKKMRSVEYRKKFRAAKDIFCTFYDSGHILGSACVVLDVFDNANKRVRLAYAVDLGRKDIPLLYDPDELSGVDYLIIESTYGARRHDKIGQAKLKLIEVINQTIKRGGKIIIPAFALERTQEIIYYLDVLMKEKLIPKIPVYVDSPLAANITEVFINYIEYLDSQTKELVLHEADPFGFDAVTYIRDPEESKRLNSDRRPMVIISSAGMCESGRILHHLRNNIENPLNTIIVVGYMAKDTLGKKLVEKRKEVKIFGEKFQLKAEVAIFNAFSAHADADELVEYIASTTGRLKKIFIVHGDMEQSEALFQSLRDKSFRPYVPKKYETVVLD